MDDFNLGTLHDSKNEWSARLLTLLTPMVMDGYRSIFEEAIHLCKVNGEMDKYLMTFQNLISRIPKWNQQIVERERVRICEKSGCTYLEDLVTCIHIIQLKILTAVRVGQKQKKIDIHIPKLDIFIHKVYINTARKIYKNVYLYQQTIDPLQFQKNNREIETIIQECILYTIRESMPVESILKAYMDESVEDQITEEVKEEVVCEPIFDTQPVPESIKVEPEGVVTTKNPVQHETIRFSDVDHVQSVSDVSGPVLAPKTFDRLEQISQQRAEEKRQEEERLSEVDNDDDFKLTIHDQYFPPPAAEPLEGQSLGPNSPAFPLNDIQVLC